MSLQLTRDPIPIKRKPIKKKRHTARQWADKGIAQAMTRAEKYNDKGQHDRARAVIHKAGDNAADWLDGTHKKIAKASDASRFGVF
jgi:hypothetical protein